MSEEPFSPHLDRRLRRALEEAAAGMSGTVGLDDVLHRSAGPDTPRQRRWLPRLRRPRPAAGSIEPVTPVTPVAVETLTPDDEPPGADAERLFPAGDRIAPVTLVRLAETLDRLDVRYLADGGGSLLALWERHAVLFTLEGVTSEILVVRIRPHATVPPDWADRAYRALNEWNHTRRFAKAYVGEPTERGQLPLYAEVQVPLMAGAHDALLVELIDCSAAVAMGFLDWLYDDGALL